MRCLYGELLKIEAKAKDHDHVPYQGRLVGDDFVKLMRTQIDDWRAVARGAKVEVIG